MHKKHFVAALILLPLGHAQPSKAQAAASCPAPLVPSTVCAASPVSLPAVSQTPPPVANGVQATPAATFLASTGVVTHAGQGNSTAAYAGPLNFLGVRNIRDSGPLPGLLILHQQTGIKVNAIWADGSIQGLLDFARSLAQQGALVSIEGPNEPNNQSITFNGQKGGGTLSWKPVAQYMQALYQGVKADPVLAKYPVLTTTEGGAETDNVGLQFIKIPPNAGTSMPDGTVYADLANTHSYVTGQHHYVDNMAWNAASPVMVSGWQWDGLPNEYGKTWLRGYQGYTDDQLRSLPRATTETGWDSQTDPANLPAGADRARLQGVMLVDTLLSQFKRGWSYTYLYHMRDGEGGSEHQGLYNNDWSPKPAATFIHNLTTIVADPVAAAAGKLDYSIVSQPATVHDLLLQKADGTFELIVWGENVTGNSAITVTLGSAHGTVKLYDVTSGTTPVQTLSNPTSVQINLTDHPIVLEML